MNEKELKQLEDELSPMMNRYLTSTPKPEDTKSLISSLQGEFDELKMMAQTRNKPRFYQVLINQFGTFQKRFWAMSVVIYGMLTIIFHLEWQTYQDRLMMLLTPLILLTGMMYSYQSWNKEMRLIEEISPFPPALILYSRLFILLMFNALFGLGVEVIYAVTGGLNGNILFLIIWLSLSLFTVGSVAFMIFAFGMRRGFIGTTILWLMIDGLRYQLNTLVEHHLLMIYGSLFIAGLAAFGWAYKSCVHALHLADGNHS